MSKPYKYVCARCGSDNVSCDATVRWNIEAQNWEISGVHDGDYCDDCEDTCRLDVEELDP